MIIVTAQAQLKSEPSHLTQNYLKTIVDLSRQEKGCLQYDLLTSTLDPSMITTYEVWQDQSALDQHFIQPHIKELLSKADSLFDSPLDVSFWRPVG